MYVRSAALAAGHAPDEVNDMTLADAERIAMYGLSHGGFL